MVYDFCFEKSYPAITDNTMKDCIYQFARYNKLSEQLFSQYVRSQARNRQTQPANSWFTFTLFENKLKLKCTLCFFYRKSFNLLNKVNCLECLEVFKFILFLGNYNRFIMIGIIIPPAEIKSRSIWI